MAACGSLDHIFDKPLPESSTLLESLSPWNSIKSIGGESSFTELFGELHFKESNADVVPEPSSPVIQDGGNPSQDSIGSSGDVRHGESWNYTGHRKLHSFSSMNSDSLSLCTEGLGFESFDDVEDLLNNDVCNNELQHREEMRNPTRHSQSRRPRACKGAFPPPISCIGRNGKPWVCFKSYRQDGRFILKEVRIPTQEFLHACRENGRLRLQFISDDDEIDEQNNKGGEDACIIEEVNEGTSNNDNGDDNVET